jgi:hypothetical protein
MRKRGNWCSLCNRWPTAHGPRCLEGLRRGAQKVTRVLNKRDLFVKSLNRIYVFEKVFSFFFFLEMVVYS